MQRRVRVESKNKKKAFLFFVLYRETVTTKKDNILHLGHVIKLTLKISSILLHFISFFVLQQSDKCGSHLV
jgi:hypothetical protein